MAEMFGAENVEQLIHYVTPEREMLHRTIAFVAANVRTESIDHFYATVNQCYQTYCQQSLRDRKDKHSEMIQLS